MIYVLTSFDRNYSKYYEGFLNNISKNFNEHTILIVGVRENEFSVEEREDFFNKMEESGISGKIIEVKEVPSRYKILEEAYAMSTSIAEENYFIFIDIDDEVELPSEYRLKMDQLIPKDLYFLDVVTMYDQEVKPTPEYINIEPSDPYYTWGSVIWGRFYSSRVVSKALDSILPSGNALDSEYVLLFTLAYLSQIGAGCEKINGGFYLWKRHSGSLTAALSPDLETCVNLVDQIESDELHSAKVEAAFTLLSNIASKRNDWNLLVDRLCNMSNSFKSLCFMKFSQFCPYWRGMNIRSKVYNFMVKRDSLTYPKTYEPECKTPSYRRLVMVTTLYSGASADNLEAYMEMLNYKFYGLIMSGKVIPVVLYEADDISIIKRLLSKKDKGSNKIINKIVFFKKSDKYPLRHECLKFLTERIMKDSDWLTFVDSDDILNPTIMDLVNSMDPRGKSIIVNFPVTRSDGDREYLKKYMNYTYESFLEEGMGVAIWGRLFSKSLIESCIESSEFSTISRNYKTGWGEELPLMHLLFSEAFSNGEVKSWKGVNGLGEGVYVWRKTEGSLSSKVDIDSAAQNIKVSSEMFGEDSKKVASILAMRLGFALPLKGTELVLHCEKIGRSLRRQLTPLPNLSPSEQDVYTAIYNASNS